MNVAEANERMKRVAKSGVTLDEEARRLAAMNRAGIPAREVMRRWQALAQRQR